MIAPAPPPPQSLLQPRKLGPLIPNEHGAWGMLTTAFLLGWWATPPFSWRPLYLVPAVVGIFLMRYPVGLYFKKRRVTRAMQISLTREKRWFWIYLVFTVLVALPLFWKLAWWWLWLFVGPSGLIFFLHLQSIQRRQEKSLTAEVTAMLGLALLVPAASYAGLLYLRWDLLSLMGLFVFYYLWRIITIRSIVKDPSRPRTDIKKMGKRELLYSAFFLLIVVGGAHLFYFINP